MTPGDLFFLAWLALAFTATGLFGGLCWVVTGWILNQEDQ